MRSSRLALVLPIVFLLAGCGGHGKATAPLPADGLPAGTPAADSPEHLLQRFEATWVSRVPSEYAALLTSDYRYAFSLDADPDLVSRFPEGLTRPDEVGTITNLFKGYVFKGTPIDGAKRITMDLSAATVEVDPDHADSTAHYRLLHFDPLRAVLEFPSAIDYDVAAEHVLQLVRGDAAVLPAGSVADSTRWYIRGWKDLSLPFGAITASAIPSLGHIKSLYLPPSPTPPDDGLPDGTPLADSPTHVLARMEATWESQVEPEYLKLLSADFRFRFSAASDPVLVDRYGNNWTRDDEHASTVHLFDGFTNSLGDVIAGASVIDMTLTGLEYLVDPDHPDSTVEYQKIVVTAFDMTVQVPNGIEPVFYQVDSRQEIYVVRGDVAVLPPGVVPDINRWYIRRWDDLSVPLAARKGPVINPARASTLGSIKSFYRD